MSEVTDTGTDDGFGAFAALVEETFDRPRGSVVPATRCDEVPGWDSLGHSVLLARLSKRHALALTESHAAMPHTAGAMHASMVALARAVA